MAVTLTGSHVPNATHCNNNDSNTFILTVTITFSRFSGTKLGINTHIKRLNVVFLAQECINTHIKRLNVVFLAQECINTHIKRLNVVFLAQECILCLAYTLLEKRDFILKNSKFRYKCYLYWASSLKEKKLCICLWEKCVSLKWRPLNVFSLNMKGNFIVSILKYNNTWTIKSYLYYTSKLLMRTQNLTYQLYPSTFDCSP